MSPERLSGWRKSPRDERDALRGKPVRIEELPRLVDLRQWDSAIGDQDGLDECTGFGIMYSIEAQGRKDADISMPLSPDWGYAGARKLEGTLGEDSGAYSRDVYKWCFPNGCLPEAYHPFDTRLDTTDPLTWPNAAQALRWCIESYARCVDGWEGICTALADGYFVSIGNPWYDAWMSVGADGMLTEKCGPDAGGHQTYLVGYDLDRRVFILHNSWGKGWGLGGYAYLPFSALDVFKRDGGYDAFYAVVAPERYPVPAVDPEPDPEPVTPKKLWPWWAWALGAVVVIAIVGLLL